MKLSLFTSKTVFLFLFAFILPLTVSAAAQKSNNYTIGSEDILEIIVLGQQDLHRTIEVAQNGTISFPLIGEIQASGRTIYELENDIAKKLAVGKFLLHAQVSIKIKQYASLKAYILGEVKKPGQYILKGRTHVFALLSEAGGITEDAGRTVIIIRGGDNGSQSARKKEIQHLNMDEIAAGADPDSSYILPGDTVQIPKAQRFYVTGEVKKTGEYKWEKNLSVRRAIAMAGGVLPTGALNRTRIERVENDEVLVTQPELTEIVKPKDIIIIPQSYF